MMYLKCLCYRRVTGFGVSQASSQYNLLISFSVYAPTRIIIIINIIINIIVSVAFYCWWHMMMVGNDSTSPLPLPSLFCYNIFFFTLFRVNFIIITQVSIRMFGMFHCYDVSGTWMNRRTMLAPVCCTSSLQSTIPWHESCTSLGM